MLTAFLTGCGSKETFEVVEDIIPVEPVAAPQQLYFHLPEEAAAPTFQDDTDEIYVCNGYTVSKQIMDSGDLEKTVKTISGKSQQEVQLIKTIQPTCDRYDFVWTAAGEDGLQLGRACILDDGNYHYTVTVMAQEESAGALRETVQEMFDSCGLLDPEVNLRTGS